jgi:acetyltransferase-like isoleucine patch superfamily enzyme
VQIGTLILIMELFLIITCSFVSGIVCLVVIKYLFLLFVIKFIETIKKRKNKNDTILNFSKVNQQAKTSIIRQVIGNIYGGLYRYLVFKIGKMSCNKLRLFIYRKIFLINISKNVVIHKGLEIRGGYRIYIGCGTIIGDDCLLDGRGGLSIGSNVNFSSKASVYTAQHDLRSPTFDGCSASVKINNRAWISSNTVVLPGVTIGEGTVLAAGGVATKNLDAYKVYGGIPAKIIGERPQNLIYNFSGKSIWFN